MQYDIQATLYVERSMKGDLKEGKSSSKNLRLIKDPLGLLMSV